MTVNEIIGNLSKEGWTIKLSSRHYQALHPKGGIVTISATPSDHRAIRNILGDIRRLNRKHGVLA